MQHNIYDAKQKLFDHDLEVSETCFVMVTVLPGNLERHESTLSIFALHICKMRHKRTEMASL